MTTLLDIDKLGIRYPDSAEPAVRSLSFSIERGATVGLVGESGSGKTQTALAILGLQPANAAVSGSIRFEGQELVGAPPSLLNRYRACRMAMVFQDPRSALNPYVRVGKQLKRILLAHKICRGTEAKKRALDMLQKVGLPDPERQYDSFPHQLSGGMRQRAMIGAALIGEPDLLIADEPTTALDVTVQAQILKLIRDLHEETNSALLLITHDLGVVAGNCERVLVMDQGRLIEEGSARKIFSVPDHEKTKALLAAAPSLTSPVMAAERPAGAETIIDISDLSVKFRERRTAWGEQLNAVKPLSFEVAEGETVAIVGESGSGKTSLVRAALGLVPPDSGTVSFLGKPLPANLARRRRKTRRQLQMVFQDPLASLNPAMLVRDIVAEPLLVHARKQKRSERYAETEKMLDRVGLERDLERRYPHELSGGQAQRVAIARALILNPRVLICDEAVAALDVTVQDEILRLLIDEQRRSGLSIVFITHDLAVVRQISHRVLVMYMGRLCELAPNEAIYGRPRHPYSKALLDSVPVPDPGVRQIDVPLAGEVSSILKPPGGCPFHPRCQYAVAACSEQAPEPRAIDGVVVACHRAAEIDLSY